MMMGFFRLFQETPIRFPSFLCFLNFAMMQTRSCINNMRMSFYIRTFEKDSHTARQPWRPHVKFQEQSVRGCRLGLKMISLSSSLLSLISLETKKLAIDDFELTFQFSSSFSSSHFVFTIEINTQHRFFFEFFFVAIVFTFVKYFLRLISPNSELKSSLNNFLINIQFVRYLIRRLLQADTSCWNKDFEIALICLRFIGSCQE